MDIAEAGFPAGMMRAAAADDTRPLAITVTDRLDDVADLWDALGRRGVGSPYQARPFVEAWFRQFGTAERVRPVWIAGRTAGAEGFILPLAMERFGPARVARLPGGSHATYNLGLFDPAVWQRLTGDDVRSVHHAIADSGLGIDLLRLDYQPRRYLGRDNPFVDARAVPAEHDCYAADLAGGFEALLARHRGSRKRGRMKQRQKALQPVGGYRLIRAETESQALDILEAFFRQKAARFAEQGLPDVFACPRQRSFLRDAVVGLLRAEGATADAWALEIDGQIRATSVGARIAGAHHAMVNSFAQDEHARQSPGEITLFHLLEDCCARGLTRYDFGVGDMRYKRSWTDEEVALAQSLVPLSATGAAAVALVRARRRLRDAVVGHPRLHRFVQRLRRARSTALDESGED